MEPANERKSILRRLWSDRIVPALFSEEQTFGAEDSSEDESGQPDASGDRSTRRTSVDDSRGPILTPEEHILELVAQHGGRMRQGEIVSNVDWSESTVSRKLQKLEGAGDISRYQLGREKLVYLPGQEPTALESPFARDEEKAPLVH